jgi:hypothetical protein
MVLLLWLLFYDGGKTVWRVLRMALPLALLNVKGSVGSAMTSAAASSTSLRVVLRIQSTFFNLRRSKIALAVGACLCALLLVKVFYFVADALAVVILLGAAAKTERTVAQRLTPLYEEMLAFWVLALSIELAGQVPIIGYFVIFLRPLLLGALLVGAAPALRLLLWIMPATISRVGKQLFNVGGGSIASKGRSPGARKMKAARLTSPAAGAESPPSNSGTATKDKRE